MLAWSNIVTSESEAKETSSSSMSPTESIHSLTGANSCVDKYQSTHKQVSIHSLTGANSCVDKHQSTHKQVSIHSNNSAKQRHLSRRHTEHPKSTAKIGPLWNILSDIFTWQWMRQTQFTLWWSITALNCQKVEEQCSPPTFYLPRTSTGGRVRWIAFESYSTAQQDPLSQRLTSSPSLVVILRQSFVIHFSQDENLLFTVTKTPVRGHLENSDFPGESGKEAITWSLRLGTLTW